MGDSMKKWITYKRRLLELQDTLNRNPIQDAFIALAIEILLALLEDRIEKSSNQYNELGNARTGDYGGEFECNTNTVSA